MVGNRAEEDRNSIAERSDSSEGDEHATSSNEESEDESSNDEDSEETQTTNSDDVIDSPGSLRKFIDDDGSKLALDDESYSETYSADEEYVSHSTVLRDISQPTPSLPPLFKPAVYTDLSHNTDKVSTSSLDNPLLHSDPERSYSLPSYQNRMNSCWLDCCLELLYQTALLDFDDFTSRFSSVPQNSTFYHLWRMLSDRRVAEDAGFPNGSVKSLSTSRDAFRLALLEEPNQLINSEKSMENILAWLEGLLRLFSKERSKNLLQPYFQGFYVKLRACYGPDPVFSRSSSGAHPMHLTIDKSLRLRFSFRLHDQEFIQHHGDIQSWANARFSRRPVPENIGCWRHISGEKLCSGTATCTEVFVSVPTTLWLEPDISPSQQKARGWFYPEIITLTAPSSDSRSMVYDIVGRVLFSSTLSHYTVRFVRQTEGRGKKIFQYDGLYLGCNAHLMHNARIQDYIAGTDANLQGLEKDFYTTAVAYRLRGGMEAQQGFLTDHHAALRRFRHVTLSSSELDSLTVTVAELRVPGYSKVDDSVCPWKLSRSSYEEYTAHTGAEPREAGDTRAHAQRRWPRQAPVPTLTMRDSESSLEPERPPQATVLADLRDSDTEEHNFGIHCRCGLTGTDMRLFEGLEGVKCTQCKLWSHVSCQRNGRASDPSNLPTFVCDVCYMCDSSYSLVSPQRPRGSSKKRDRASAASRLLVGKGALIRRGPFWYPVWLLLKYISSGEVMWRVKPWRLCEFIPPLQASECFVVQTDLIDDLWRDREGRRQIRLGKWVHPSSLPDEDAFLMNPSACKFDEEVAGALRPHQATLASLLRFVITNDDSTLESIDISLVPAFRFADSNKGSTLEAERKGMVPFYGDLGLQDQAGIINWISSSLELASGNFRLWSGSVVPAHAATLLLASRHADSLRNLSDFPQAGSAYKQQRFIMERAWTMQISPSDRVVAIDVDAECLSAFEEGMFERSKAAGIAGECQWGLDAGDHQCQWCPYDSLPSHWTRADYPVCDDYERGPDFVEEPPPPPPPGGSSGKKRPLPRPILNLESAYKRRRTQDSTVPS